VLASTARLSLAAALALVLAGDLKADFVVGQVKNPQGVGVAGVDLDFDNLRGGGRPDSFNEGTDAGGFFTTTVDPGFYDIIFTPPAPPASTLLVGKKTSVVVSGTANLGVVTLAQGVGVQARLVNPSLLPVANVNLDILDTSGNLLVIPGAHTDLFGKFNIAVPAQVLEFRYNTLGVFGQTLAPKVQTVDTTNGVAKNLGDVVLAQGFHLTATFLRPNGLPVANTDTDTFDSATGNLAYTPGDNTNNLGAVDIVLAAGTYDFVVCPAIGTGLAALGFKNVPVTSNLAAGTFTLQAGFTVSGTVRNSLNQPLAGIDVDVNDAFGNEIVLCGDSTNSLGQYQVAVPAGTWTIEFTPSYALPYGKSINPGQLVSGAKLLNATLPNCPGHVLYGAGLAGTGGLVPSLVSSGGSGRIGNPDYSLVVSNARGKARAVVVSGFASAAVPFHGGTLLVDTFTTPFAGDGFVSGLHGKNGVGGPAWPINMEMLFVKLGGTRGVAGSGNLTIAAPIPNAPVLVGTSRFSQVLVEDPATAGGWALSRGMRVDYLD